MNFVPFHVCDIFDDVDDIVRPMGSLRSLWLIPTRLLKSGVLKNRQIPYMNSTLDRNIVDFSILLTAALD